MQKIFFLIGAFFALTGVAMGAFGAHALKNKLSIELLNAFEVGVRYQMYHALAIIMIALVYLHFNHSLIALSLWSIIAGICVFSGSLYLLALTGVRLFGAITPIGGILLLLGWIFFALGILKS